MKNLIVMFVVFSCAAWGQGTDKYHLKCIVRVDYENGEATEKPIAHIWSPGKDVSTHITKTIDAHGRQLDFELRTHEETTLFWTKLSVKLPAGFTREVTCSFSTRGENRWKLKSDALLIPTAQDKDYITALSADCTLELMQ